MIVDDDKPFVDITCIAEHFREKHKCIIGKNLLVKDK